MSESGENRPYDLEDRTFFFAQDVRALIKILERTIANVEDAKQVVRSSGSVAANYIEANEALSKKDFRVKIKVCRKEAKESRLWLRLIDTENRPQAQSPRGASHRRSTGTNKYLRSNFPEVRTRRMNTSFLFFHFQVRRVASHLSFKFSELGVRIGGSNRPNQSRAHVANRFSAISLLLNLFRISDFGFRIFFLP